MTGQEAHHQEHAQPQGATLPDDAAHQKVAQEYAGDLPGFNGRAQSSSSAGVNDALPNQVDRALPLGGRQAMQFFSLAPFAVAIFDRDMRYMAASKQWIKDYRLQGKRVLGKSQYDVFPNMSDAWRELYERCLSGEKFDEQESKFEGEGARGEEWISWKMHPWTTDEGDIGGVILFTEFISAQKQRSLELERNQAFLEVVLNSVHDGIVACDADGNLTLFNEATKSLHGLPAEPIPPEEWANHYSLFRPDGETPLAKEEIPLFRALNGEQVDGAEMVIAPTGLKPRRILSRGTALFDSNGDKIGAVATMHDVTEEREFSRQLADSEKQFRKLYNETPAMLHSVDRDGKLIRVSDYWLQTLGYERDEVIGKQFFDLLPDDSREYVKKEVLPAFVQRGELDNVEFTVLKKDGSSIDVQLSVVAQRNETGFVESSITVLTDISARKLAETDLRQSETHFRNLYNTTPAMLHSVDRNGRLIRVSDFWLESLGYKREEIIGTRFLELVPEEKRDHVRGTILKFFAEHGYLENVEFQLQKKSGEVMDVQLSAVSEYGEDNERTNSLTVVTDITDRKSAERELRASEEQFRGAFEASPQGMALVKPNTEWIGVNAALCEILGYEKQELLNLSIREITHPDDLNNDLTHVQELMAGTRTSYQLEKRYLHKDGSTVWALISVMLVRDSNNEPVHFVIQMLDLTDRKRMERALKRSEEQFRSAFETSPQGMALVSPGGRWLTANKALCDMFGYEKTELLEKGIQGLTHPQDIDTEVEDIKRLLRGDGHSFEIEKRYLHKSGATIWGQVCISLIRDDAGEPAQFVFQMIDLTQRRAAEEQLVQAQKLEAVGQLTGGLAHDFNNLLAVILISLQLLERSHADDPKSLKRIKAGLDATERGADLTRRLLAFSRKQSLEQKVVGVRKLIKSMSGMLQRTLGGAISLTTHYDSNLWKIETDPSQLETGILNLAINSRDAMPGGGELTIEAKNVVIDEAYAGSHSEVSPGNYVLIAVSDTGEGIPQNIVEQVFQPFFTTKEVGKGSGLGLSMVYGFVKQSKGHIEVYSEQDVGTSIKLYLPAVLNAEETVVAEEKEANTEVIGGDEVVLVAEDDPAVRQSVTSLLSSLGYQILEAENAYGALDIISAESSIDLLFSDIIMPGGMDGIDLAEQAKLVRPGLKVLLTTGFAEAAVSRNKSLALKSEIIGKPYRREQVAMKIRSILDA